MSYLRLNLRDIALVTAFALCVNVAGQHNSKVTNDKSSNKQLENIIYNSKSNISDKLGSDTIHYKQFKDRNFILDQYDRIPVRDKHKPLYEKLVYDKTGDYFCYVFPRNFKGLRNAFRKTHDLLEKNGADEFNPNVDYTNLPDHEEMPKGSVHEDHTVGYILLDGVLSTGLGYIDKEWWRVKSHYDVKAKFDSKEYILIIKKRK
jgi:hypothetical protein